MLGFDSTSHANFIRRLPLTLKWMEDNLQFYNHRQSQENELKQSVAFEMNGFTIVGDGTTVQLTGMLTGKRPSDHYEGRSGHPDAKRIDDWPWIFKPLR